METKKITLRDYQQEMLDRLHEAWKVHRSVMLQMPTGTGKTVLLTEVIHNAQCTVDNSQLANGNAQCHISNGDSSRQPGVLIVAHRRELLEQIRETIAKFGIDGRRDGVRVESIQKLTRQPDSLCDFEPALVIIDEAHHALAKTYRTLWERWPQARFLGLTATPCRLNNAPFTDLFDTLLQSWTIQEFIDRGWLADFEYVSARPDSRTMRQIRLLKKRGADGDYQQKETAAVMDVPESIRHLYDTYRQFAWGKKGIVYAIDRSHARHIAAYYREQGVNCCVIDSRTPAGERARLVEDYRRDRLQVLVNVDIFGEGFDVPEVEFIQLARPTLSLSKYLQQVGRGMRVSEGKPHVLILDMVGLYQLFGLPTAERDWRRMFLGRDSGKGQAGLTRCVVADGDVQEKELVNLEMVRIKSGGEKRNGLEVFLQDGRYGVMRNGRVTCPARFRKVERLDRGSGFFALGIFGVLRNGKAEVMTTVIDNKGQDMNIRLPGKVAWTKGYFCGIYTNSMGEHVNCWDPVGNSYYYDTYPGFQKVAGVEIACATEDDAYQTYCNKLRYSTGKVSPRFDLWEMFYNQWIIIARDYLVVKHDRNHSYRICGYLDDSILVQNEEQYGYQQIFLNGEKGELYRSMPRNATRIMNQSRLGLQRVEKA